MNIDLSGLKVIMNSSLGIHNTKVDSFHDWFDENFMIKYTDFLCIEEFLTSSNIDFSDPDKIDHEKLNEFIQNSSVFTSWQDMQDKSISLLYG